jgi:broad specificity phosphatase PhoE
MMSVMTQSGPRVILVRHGETEWSRDGRHTGRTDLPLTEIGEAQARAVGDELALERPGPFDVVLVSPLLRAIRTAQLARLWPAQITEDLREWDYGDLEGRTSDDIGREYPGWSIWNGPWPGGEDAEAVSARADRVIERVLSEPVDAAVAVVAHGHILRVLAARWLATDVTAGRWLALGTATVSELGWEHDDRVIDRWNMAVRRNGIAR